MFQGKLPSCSLCNGLQKKDENEVRLAIEMRPSDLAASVRRGCHCCTAVLAAVKQFGEAAWANGALSKARAGAPSWDLVDAVTMIIAYGLSADEGTLFLELYPKDESRTKRTLELFLPGSENGNWISSPRLRALIQRYSGLKPTRPRPVEAVRRRPSPSSHPLSPAGLRWVQVQLKSCLKDHAVCPREKNTTLPKRLLEFKKSSGTGGVSVRLRTDHPNQGPTQRYAALSHCWGTDRACTTTQGTLQRHTEAIPWSEISHTFQDAIHFCLAIGVNLLWVDALCIVQDDPVDWQVESAQMANIYQNAYVTLAATHASSGAGGCFPLPHHRAPVTEQSLLLPSKTASHWRGVKFREKLNHWSVPLTPSSSKLYPLLTRGWVFQERVLSPRVLHFCAEEMIWECNSMSICECGSLPVYASAREPFNDIVESQVLVAKDIDGLPGYPDVDHVTEPDVNLVGQLSLSELGWRHGGFYPLQASSLFLPVPGNDSFLQAIRRRRLDLFKSIDENREETTLQDKVPVYDDSHLYRKVLGDGRVVPGDRWLRRFQNDQSTASFQWQRLVELYSGLRLSKETDRLPALSGIAARAQPHLGRYLAGLWSSTLQSDLLWRVTKLELGSSTSGESATTTTTSTPQGPSWSWASNSSAVSFWEDLRVELTLPELPGWKMRRPKFESSSVELAGRNPFGEVAPGGDLVVNGFLKSAVVRYVWTRPWLSSDDPNSSIARELDPLKYELDFGLELPLLADHVLSEKGSPHYLPDGASVSMLLLHPDVCLVLRACSDSKEEGGGKEREKDAPAGMDHLPTYRRIGIMKQPDAFAQIYTGAIDWMANSVRKRIRII